MAASPAAATVLSTCRPAVAAPLSFAPLVELTEAELLELREAEAGLLDEEGGVVELGSAGPVGETSLRVPPAAASAEEALAADAERSSSEGPV